MGVTRTTQERQGLKRPGPATRGPIEDSLALKRMEVAERKRSSRAAARLAEEAAREAEIADAPDDREEPSDAINSRDQRRVGLAIASSISKALLVCPNARSRKLCMQYVLSHTLVRRDLPEYILPVKEAMVQQEIVAGVTRALEENKTAASAINLATKHTILTAAVSAKAGSSFRGVAKVLDIHPRNLQSAVSRRVAIDDGGFLWTLSVRKKRSDGLTEYVKAVVILWWAQNTRVSPNRKEIARKRTGPGEWDEKPTHFLMETQVCHLHFKLHLTGWYFGMP